MVWIKKSHALTKSSLKKAFHTCIWLKAHELEDGV